jgi:hypothetical protein
MSTMWESLWNIAASPAFLCGATAVSVLILLVGFWMVPVIAVKLPVDHFVRPARPIWNPGQSWWLQLTRLIIRNLIALVLFVAGILMLVLPGPGIISIIVAVAIAEFPGKYKLEHWFINNWIVQRALNAIRAKHGAPPLLLPGQHLST